MVGQDVMLMIMKLNLTQLNELCLEVNGLPAIQTPLPLSDCLLLSSIEIEITKNFIFYFTKSQKIC